jgi:beta-hydroxylase
MSDDRDFGILFPILIFIIIVLVVVLIVVNHMYFYNLYIYYTSIDPLTPFMNLDHRVTIQKLKSQWLTIKNEVVPLIDKFSPIQGDLFFTDDIIETSKWKKIYLKWYGASPSYAYEMFPETMQIIDSCPDINLAMFSLLEPHSEILPHNGPFRGSIRIHVTLVSPNDERCFIDVDGERYVWKEGEVVAFDDTYRHYVKNDTDESRLVLFIDIERTLKYSFINDYIIKYIAPRTARINEELEKEHAAKK